MDIFDFPSHGGRRAGAGRKPLPKQYEVLAVDGDGTVQLVNLNAVQRAISRNTVWAYADEPLAVGEVVEGKFDFDPRESLIRGFPSFTRTDL